MSDYNDHSSILSVADESGQVFVAFATFDVDARFATFIYATSDFHHYPFSGIIDPLYVY